MARPKTGNRLSDRAGSKDLDAFANTLNSLATLPRTLQTEQDTWAEPDGDAPIRRIRVITGYRGKRSHEQFIAPGDYAEIDPILHGLADFLLDSGRAVQV